MDVDDFLHLGAINTSLLTMQSVHCTEAIWRNQKSMGSKTWFDNYLNHMPVDADEKTLRKYARAYILCLLGLTLIHAIAACKFTYLEVSDFVPHEYTLQAYNMTWSYQFSPLPHADVWNPMWDFLIGLILTSNVQKWVEIRLGEGVMRWTRGMSVSPVLKRGFIITTHGRVKRCKLCKQTGHNKRACPFNNAS
ncbi:hypothetical protein QQ045_027386 [Rhodiola kirilowii]